MPDGIISLPRDTIAIERTKFLWQAVCYERICFRNYADSTRHFQIEIGFGADFHDLFEVRGTSREPARHLHCDGNQGRRCVLLHGA